MTAYRFVKAHPGTKQTVREKTNPRRKASLAAKGMLIGGALVVASVVWPILSYELFTAPTLTKQDYLLPVPAQAQQQEKSTTTDTTDLTRAENWFPSARSSTKTESKITHYTLSIPKFGIVNATVEIDGEDLSKNLVQFPGTAFPGEIGAPVIFGHSILPQFFNPQNYLSIFSLIPTMELGDEIIVRFDGITYTYNVIDKIEVKPDDLSVLEQPYDNEYLRLITCTPPGTYLRRGVITAALVD